MVRSGASAGPSPSQTDVIVEQYEIEKETRVAIRKARQELGRGSEDLRARAAALSADRDRRKQVLETDYWRRVLSQAETVKILSRLLPAGCVTHALTGLTGTDVHYVSEVRAARGRMKAAYEVSGENPQSETINPTLDIVYPNLGDRLTEIAIDIGLLAGYLVALFLAAHVGFLRHDIH